MFNFSVDVLPWQRLTVAARLKAQLRADLNVVYRFELESDFWHGNKYDSWKLEGSKSEPPRHVVNMVKTQIY